MKLTRAHVDEALLELDRIECEESLATFLRGGWRYIDPAQFIDGWVIDALAEHLEAVVDGQIRKLLINLPPRSLKSTIAGVALPAFTWAQRHDSHTSGPGVKFLHASYADKLSLRDSVRCRRLIESPWYRRLWGDRFSLTKDQNAKHRFSNDKGGERLITSVGAGVTGEGYNIGVWDDINAANEIESEASVEEVIEWWDGTMSTRMNDPRQSAWVGIQQRLGETDWSGHVLSKNSGDVVHLCLPMRYESSRSFVTAIGWEDPRTEEGQLLWPERFGEAEVKALEREMGPWRAAGQLQQRPSPKGGGIIKRDWWQLWEAETFPMFDYILASLDTAYTEETANDPSAMTVWGVFSGDIVAQPTRTIGQDGRPRDAARLYADMAPKVMLMAAWQDRLELHELVQKVGKTCKTMKVDKLLIENKAAGHSVAQEIRRLFSHEGFAVQLSDPRRVDKTARLYSVQHLFAEGIVYAPERSWSDMVITQVESFPKVKFDDLCDTVSQALRHLRDLGMLIRGEERRAEIEEMQQYRGKPPPPLYPV